MPAFPPRRRAGNAPFLRPARRAARRRGCRGHLRRTGGRMIHVIDALLTGKARIFGDGGETSAIAKDPVEGPHTVGFLGIAGDEQAALSVDRKRVVWGKRVSVRVVLGGRRTLKKKKKK